MTGKNSGARGGAPRYALYVAPEPDSGLAGFAAAWLGRDPGGKDSTWPTGSREISRTRLRALTATPRHYGFHATLKPPFRLVDGARPEDLLKAVQDFVRGQKPVAFAGLQLAAIGGFLALVPAGSCAAIDRLAADCLRFFEPFRAPARQEEIERRKRRGLSPRQEQLLYRWGYPYVLEEFRFHFTLTGPLGRQREKEILQNNLAAITEKFRHRPYSIESICVFSQPSLRHPFQLIERFAFAGQREESATPTPAAKGMEADG